MIGWSEDGSTRYYDYGRYSGSGIIGEKLPGNDGNYRRIPIPDLAIGPDGKPTKASLKALKNYLKEKIGKNTEADLECDDEADENKVYNAILKDAMNKNRDKYNWNPFNSNTCQSVAEDAFDAGRKKWWQ